MNLFHRSRGVSPGIGLSPGEIINKPELADGPLQLNALRYSNGQLAEESNVGVGLAREWLTQPGVLWLQCSGIHDVEGVQAIADAFGLHRLAIEDILSDKIRPKVDLYEDQLLVIGQTAIYNSDDHIQMEQIAFIVGPGYLISFQETDGALFAPVMQRIRNSKGKIRSQNEGYLLFALLDVLADHLLATLDELEDSITKLDEDLLDHMLDRRRVEDIFRHKRAILQLARLAWPMREMANRIEATDFPSLSKGLKVYYRSLSDNTRRSTERTDHARLTLQNMQEFYHMEQEHRSTEVMRVLTVIATIFIPVTFIAGVYGMNFNPETSAFNMPELEWRYGYFICLGLMASFIIGMLTFFRRKGWI